MDTRVRSRYVMNTSNDSYMSMTEIYEFLLVFVKGIS